MAGGEREGCSLIDLALPLDVDVLQASVPGLETHQSLCANSQRFLSDGVCTVTMCWTSPTVPYAYIVRNMANYF